MDSTDFRERATGKWRKSSYSGGQGDCVFIAKVGDVVGIVEADDPEDSSAPVVLTPLANFRAFVAGAKAGEFDL